jgi:hypothetical protein
MGIPLFAAHRLWMTFTGRCLLDSDESVFGIMAIEAMRGELHAFFHGQDHMGSFQALIAVPFMAVLGSTPLALRVTAIAEGVVVLLCWRRILGRWGLAPAWVFFSLLFALPPEFIATWTLKSRGGIETLMLGSLWLAILTSITSSPDSSDRHWTRWFALGLVTGLGWWTSQLIIFFYLPGALHALLTFPISPKRPDLLQSEGPGRTRPSAHLLIVGLFGLSLALLLARGTVSYESALSDLLHEWRLAVVLQFAAVSLLCLVLWRRWGTPLWPLTLGGGILLGHLPALWVILTKESLYNITETQELQTLFTNLLSLALLVGGSMIGLLDEALRPLNLPAVLFAVVPGISLAAVALLFLGLLRATARTRRPPPAESFLALALVISAVLLGLTVQRYQGPPRYALFGMVFLTLTLGWFLARVWTLSRPAAAALLVILICVNLHSVAALERHPIRRTTMVTAEDQALIDFLTEKGITAASTGLFDTHRGYWHAYRLTFAAQEELTVHPSLHMPRIPRYREVLRHADRCAVITSRPGPVSEAFARHGIDHSRQEFGDLTVFSDFDKRRVDELGLISYRDSL